jgi:hypothetical protein
MLLADGYVASFLLIAEYAVLVLVLVLVPMRGDSVAVWKTAFKHKVGIRWEGKRGAGQNMHVCVCV